MKIAYCILGTYNSRGMERVLSNKANYLADRMGYDVSVITTDQKGRPPYFKFSDSIRHYDLGIDYTDDYGKNFIYRKLFSRKKALHRKRLEKLLGQLHCDVVVTMMNEEFFFLHRIKDGSAKVAEFHFSRYSRTPHRGDGWIRLFSRYLARRDERTVRRYARLVVLTEEDKGYWSNLDNVEVIPNALSFIPREQAELDNKTVCSVGGLTDQKGYDMLINAWKDVAARHPDWRLDIYGSGPLHATLSTRIEELSLGDSVRILPPTPEIERVYLQSSIYALSSRYEGLPMVLLESMACGVPSVAFSCPCGPRDVLSNRGGGGGSLWKSATYEDFPRLFSNSSKTNPFASGWDRRPARRYWNATAKAVL